MMKRIKTILKSILTNTWFYFSLFVVSLIVPFIINELYKKGDGYQTIWGAPEVLSFYGSYLSFLGAVFLGAVAVFQTKRANEQTDKANKLASQMQKTESAKFVSMVSIKGITVIKQLTDKPKYRNPQYNNLEIINMCADGFRSDHSYFIDALFENNSDYPIVQISVYAGEYENVAHKLYGIKTVFPTIYIPPKDSQAVRFIIPCKVFEHASKHDLVLKIRLTNVFDYVTSASLYLTDIENPTKSGEWFYRLAKFTDINPHNDEKS